MQYCFWLHGGFAIYVKSSFVHKTKLLLFLSIHTAPMLCSYTVTTGVMGTYWQSSLRYNGIPGSWRSVHWWGNALHPLHEKLIKSVSDLAIDFNVSCYCLPLYKKWMTWAKLRLVLLKNRLVMTCHHTNVAVPFWSISRCSQRMSPTKSGAKSRKRSFPIAHRLAPFMQNLSKSTIFRLNSFTVHVNHAATWFSVHCLGSVHGNTLNS